MTTASTGPSLPKIVACYVAVNEADMIAESLRSIKAYVDRVVVIDAIFDSNPTRSTHSTDNQREVVQTICNAPPTLPLTYIESAAKLTQPYARNAYLEQVHPPDWAFVIDSDEILYGEHATILTIMEAIRSGRYKHSVSIPVYTVAVNANKMAPDITREEFAAAPLISTMGYMPRLVATEPGLRYASPRGASTPVLTFLGDETHPAQHLLPAYKAAPGEMFLINHHTRQSLESYQNDYVWETEGVLP